jgi:UDPglucose 6-dehydrogenase
LATKVSFANEIKQICAAAQVDYKEVKDLALWDKRIGPTHLGVPGPDGSMGFGGTCFPKDLNCLIYFACKNDVEPLMLKSVWEKNLEVRKDEDWVRLKGRAVSE